jgi:hypothetical protein
VGRLIAWGILTVAFLLAGEGLNLVRTHLELWLAYGHPEDIAWMGVGLAMAVAFSAFLGGFVIYRDKKRGKIRREGWRGRSARHRGTKPARPSEQPPAR